MTSSTENLEPRLRETALIILRRHHIGDDDVRIAMNEPHEAASSLISGHRVRVELNDESVAFRVHAGRWSGRRADYPTAGSFVAAFEEALENALAGG